MQLPLQHGAQVDAVDREQSSALRLASWQGQTTATCLLLDCDTHIGQACSQGAMVLGIAAQEGHVVLERGTNPCLADSHGWTPALAAQRGHATIPCLLEQHGSPAVPSHTPHAATHLSDTSPRSSPASPAGCSLAVAVPVVLAPCSHPPGYNGLLWPPLPFTTQDARLHPKQALELQFEGPTCSHDCKKETLL